MEHMTRNDLFSKQQFGLLPGRSTTLQLLKVKEEWTSIMDKDGTLDTVYMDFMKAFDTVPHKRLLGKLKSYGLSKQLIRWIKDFLSNRQQKVVVNGVASENKHVTSGIPQGSVLGPVLFVIYINDLPDDVKAATYLFADDTKIYKEIKSEDDKKDMQDDLDALHAWTEKWLLRFHPDKCKVMTIQTQHHKETTAREYYLYNQKGERVKLESVDKEKDIGVVVDKNLSFKAHRQAQINKANGIMGLIRRTFTYLDEEIFTYLFKALVRPHLEYAVSVWGPQSKTEIIAVENVQKRATKLVPTLKDLDYPSRLKRLKLPTLKYRRLRGDMIEAYKIINGVYDRGVTDNMFEKIDNSSTRGHSLKLKKERTRLDIRKYSFTNRINNVWNSLPEYLVNEESIFKFEVGLDNLWKNQEIKYDFSADHIMPGSYVYPLEKPKENEEVDIRAELA